MTPTTAPAAITAERRAVLNRRIRWIVAGTIGYNVIEAVIAITAGTIASSSALIAFGLDSVVEVLSAAAVAWQFAAPDPLKREHVAMRLIAVSFIGLALFVTIDAIRALTGAAEPEHSTVGIVLAAVSLLIMPALSLLERRTGRELGSGSAVADSKQTLLCAYLSAVLLVGLVLNSLLGWTWADPVAALLIATFAIREGVEAWRGDACCTPAAAMLVREPAESSDGCTDECCAPASSAVRAQGLGIPVAPARTRPE